MSVIAKKYVKAIREEFAGESLIDLNELLKVLSKILSDSKAKTVLTSNLTSNSEKEKIILDFVEASTKSKNSVKTEGENTINVKVASFIKEEDKKRVSNLLKLLVKNGRISEIPAISKELVALLSIESGKFEGKLQSSNKLSEDSISSIAIGLSKKLGKEITLIQEVGKSSGIKVIIEELHVEISVSADRIKTDMINHILKAI
jgi:F-type H+-transporting ATPase subunit delta